VTQGLDVQDASKLIRGKVGTPITLRIERQGQSEFEVQLTRANIELPSVLHTLKQEGNSWLYPRAGLVPRGRANAANSGPQSSRLMHLF